MRKILLVDDSRLISKGIFDTLTLSFPKLDVVRLDPNKFPVPDTTVPEIPYDLEVPKTTTSNSVIMSYQAPADPYVLQEARRKKKKEAKAQRPRWRR